MLLTQRWMRVKYLRCNQDNIMQGFVYIFGATKIGPVKIGFTRNVTLRLQAFRTFVSNHTAATLLASAPGSEKEEKSVHIALSDARLDGEWFSRSHQVMRFINHVQRNGRIPNWVFDMASNARDAQQKIGVENMLKSARRPVEIVDAKFRRRGTMLWKVCNVDRSQPLRWLQRRGGAIPDRHFPTILLASKRLRAGVKKEDLIA